MTRPPQRGPSPGASAELDSDIPRHYVVAYDIASDPRRARLAGHLKGFGTRVQFSVFECCLSSRELRRLERLLNRLGNDSGDVLQVFECSRSSAITGFVDTGVSYWTV